MKKIIQISAFLVGFNSIISQVILIREFMNIFYGNEISLGIVLFFWMLWIAFGSISLCSLFNKKNLNGTSLLIICQFSFSLILLLQIFSIRIINFLLQIPSGEIIKFSPMLLSTFYITMPLCIILGFMFSLCSELYSQDEKNSSIIIGTIYLYESIGAIIGGFLYYFFIAKFMDSFKVVYILGLINSFISIYSIFLLKKSAKFTTFFSIVSIFLIFLFSYFLFINNKPYNITLNLAWKNYQLIDSKNSIYGNISIVKNKEKNQTIFFENSLLLFATPDKLAGEETAHFSLIEHKNPKRVLLIGGGFGGSINEILKHPIDRLVYAELDPLIIKMVKKYLKEEKKDLQDKRLEIINTDGRFYIKNSSEKFDIVIINLVDPLTAQLNRFFTLEFFEEIKKNLTSDGIVSIKVSSIGNYLPPEQKYYLASIKNTLNIIYPEVKILIGLGNVFFIGSNIKGNISTDISFLMQRLKTRGIKTEYVREYYLNSTMSDNRLAMVEKKLNEEKNVKINKDFNPICFYYNLVYWNALFNPEYLQFFKNILNFSLLGYIIIILFIFLILFFTSKDKILRKKKSILAAIAANGFSEILFELVIILAFQSIYGYIYYQVGLIITAFMTGLSLGTYFALKALKKEPDSFAKLINIEILTIVYTIFLICMLFLLKNLKLSKTFIEIIYPLLTCCAGFLGGYQFPVACDAYLHTNQKSEVRSQNTEQIQNTNIGKQAGFFYGIDLVGACLGIIMTNLFFIPILGIYQALFASMFLSICAVIFLFINKIRS